MRLIDADALIDILGEMQGLCQTKAALVQNSKIWQQVKNMPTIEERKKGKWIEDVKSKRYRCDQCLSFALRTDDGQENLSDFCPVCGAIMEGEQNVTD